MASIRLQLLQYNKITIAWNIFLTQNIVQTDELGFKKITNILTKPHMIYDYLKRKTA